MSEGQIGSNGVTKHSKGSVRDTNKQDAQVSQSIFSQGRLTVGTQNTPLKHSSSSSRDHSRSRKRSRDKKDKKKRSRSRSYKKRSRSRDKKRYRESRSRSRSRDKKKKDKKHKKEKKRSKKSIEREEKRKMQARLAKARMLASIQQNDGLGGGFEDDLDMPEIDTGNERNIQNEKLDDIVTEQAPKDLKMEETSNVNINPPNEQIRADIIPTQQDNTVPLGSLPPKQSKDFKIINKENGLNGEVRQQPDKKVKFEEIVEDKPFHHQVHEEEPEEGQIVEDNQKDIMKIGGNGTKKLKPNPFLASNEDKEPIFKSLGRFTAQPQVAQEEEDPFDAYMKQIEQEAVPQQNIHHPNEDVMFDDFENEEEEVAKKENVITMEDLMNNMEDEDQSDQQTENDEDFHQQFLNELKKKELQEKIKKEGNQIMFNDDDDKFLLNFEKDEEEAASFLDKEKKRTEKKDQKLISQLLNEYETINKNLYIETKEITKLTDKEIQEFRKNNGDIKVRGLKCPKPIYNWYQCGLPDKVLEVIEKKQFAKPFPIQCQSIPAIMSGRDVIGIAETGSGKTLAYVLPMIRHIRDQRPLEEGEGMIGLVMAPTRELAFQIYKESKSFAKSCGLRVVCVYGGANVQGQLSELKRGAEIVVCTPGRMIDVLTTSNGKITNLKRCSYIVLDEADRMLDMGFEPQIQRVMQNVRPDKQCVMFSATFPRQIENLAKKILQSPIEIVVGNRGQTCQNVEQFVEVMEPDDKFWKLMELLGEWYDKGSILIFVDKQIEADELFKELFKVGYKALVLHGGQDQTDREFTIQDFKDGVRNIMVATSVCARGLDIKHIKLVINYYCPNHLEDYVHRVGRTGRAGNKGTAYTFITPDECQYATDLIRALENSGNKVPEDLIELDKTYQQKVEEGEMEKKKTNQGFVGKGFEFNTSEREKVNQFRKELSKAYGMGVEEEEEDENNDNVKTAQQKEEERKLLEEQQVLQLLEKDPTARKSAIEAGNQASRNALKQGLSHEEATRVAQEAMLYVLRQYRPATVTMEKGLETVLSIRDQYIDKENEKNNIFTVEFEINDYPQQARGKAQSKEFLQSIYEMTGCKILSKGQYFEFGKKPPTGQRKLYLYIEGNSKQEVANAYKEIKRYIEENSINNQHANLNVGFSGQFTKI